MLGYNGIDIIFKVGEYIAPLLTHARGLTSDVFLQASAATFVQSWRMVDAMLEVSNSPVGDGKKDIIMTKNQAEDVVYVHKLFSSSNSF